MKIELLKSNEQSRLSSGDLIVEKYADNTECVHLICNTTDGELRLVDLTNNISYGDDYETMEDVLRDMKQYRIIKKHNYVLKELA